MGLDNAIVEQPSVACQDKGIRLNFRTRRPFQEGRVFAKGLSGRGECAWKPGGDWESGYWVEVEFGRCELERQRLGRDRGVAASLTLIVQFHPLFLTKVDGAYNLRCFWAPLDKTVTQSLQVPQSSVRVQESREDQEGEIRYPRAV